MRKVLSAIIIREGNYLLVRKKRTYLFPGGKPEGTESDEECLRREIAEELSGTQIANIKPYKHFEGISPHKGDVVRVEYYFADIVGKVGKPSAEISGAIWADRNMKLRISESAQRTINSLVADGYIS